MRKQMKITFDASYDADRDVNGEYPFVVNLRLTEEIRRMMNFFISDGFILINGTSKFRTKIKNPLYELIFDKYSREAQYFLHIFAVDIDGEEGYQEEKESEYQNQVKEKLDIQLFFPSRSQISQFIEAFADILRDVAELVGQLSHKYSGAIVIDYDEVESTEIE